ncbi:putative E3 ubiquitin-protein ligase makorin-3, partial [Mortierella alpina]
TWRAKDIAPDMHPQDRNACPNCRTPSLYIVPSSYFPTSPEQKEIIIQNYKEATARRPCKHFKESGDLHWCPFGDSCFFAHQDENGEPSSRYASNDTLEALQRGFFAGLGDLEDVSEMDIEALRLVLAELARPLDSNYASLGHDLVDLDEDEFDDYDDDDWEDEEDDDDHDDDDDTDYDEDDDDLEAAFEEQYRYMLEHHHIHH